MLDQKTVNLIIKDCQGLSTIDSEGFSEHRKYEEEQEWVKMEAQKAVAVDMWTSVNLEAYLAFTCHYIHENMHLCTDALSVQHFPQSHAADSLAQVKRGMMEDWATETWLHPQNISTL